MLTICWAAKGGSGTTVVACALALLHARQAPAWLVDLAGDSPAALGIAEPSSSGVTDWIEAVNAPESSLEALAVPAGEQLHVIPRGTTVVDSAHPRWARLSAALAGCGLDVIVDAGSSPPPALLAAAEHRLLVTRPCYLSVRRSVASGIAAPTGIVVVHEPGRALRAQDIAYAVQAPVVAEITLDPAVARAVDAGLLAARLPRSLSMALQPLAS